jgi:hypothetical protein
LFYFAGGFEASSKDSDTALHATTCTIELLGSAESINKAEQLIRDVLAEVVVIILISYFT